jgi:uroporphyrin-3 C-methyltransferase
MTIEKTTLQEKKPSSSPSHTKHYLLGLTILIALIALSFAWYAFENTEQLKLEKQVLNNKVEQLKQQQTRVKTLFHTVTQSHTDDQNTIKNRINTLDEHLKNALHQHAYQTDDWMFFKARYYLELAQINAEWSTNNDTTIALMKQADLLLSNLHDQHLLKIRQSIAGEIAEVKAIPPLDIAGMLSILNLAYDELNSIPLKSSIRSIHQNQEVSDTKTTPSTWREQFKQSLDFMKTLIVIRKQNEPIEPLPSSSEELMLREQVQLNLQAAQWSILEHNDTVYQWSIAQAIKRINHSFDLEDPKIKALLQQLDDLQKVHLIQQKNPLKESLQLLNDFIQSKDQEKPL